MPVYDTLMIVLLVVDYLLRFWVFGDSHKIVITHFERAEFVDEPFRLFLLFRLSKPFRYAHSLFGVGRMLIEKRFEVMARSIFLAQCWQGVSLIPMEENPT